MKENNKYNPQIRVEFWKDVESGEVKRFFIEWIKYAIAKTNGWDM